MIVDDEDEDDVEVKLDTEGFVERIEGAEEDMVGGIESSSFIDS